MLSENLIIDVLFGACDEVNLLLRESMEPAIINVCAVDGNAAVR